MSGIVVAALGSGCFGALIGFVSSRLSRRDAVRDRDDEVKKAIALHEERLTRVEEQVTALGVVLEALKLAQQSILRDRILYLGKKYVADGFVAVDDLETFYSLHERYHGVGGNGYCDTIVDKVKHLEIRAV